MEFDPLATARRALWIGGGQWAGKSSVAVNLALRPTLDELLVHQVGECAAANHDDETWLLLARGHDFKGESETLGRDPTGRAKLKRLLYGMEQPDRDTMRDAALPIAESLKVEALAQVSPSFAEFLTQLR